MAQPDNTIDPNDLDSIDALLDEAELEPEDLKSQDEAAEVEEVDETVSEQADENPEPQPDEAGSGFDLEEFQQPDQTPDQDEDLDLERMLDEPIAAAPPPASVQDDFPSRMNQQAQEDDDFDDFLARRAQNTKNGNELTVAEMDSLKSMIIGFGSTLIVLALIAIGVATWGALGANSSDLPSAETFEEMIGEAELGRTTSQANETLLKDLNRKLDALSFQIEQVNGDVVALSGGKLPAAASETLNPLGLNAPVNGHSNGNNNVAPTNAVPAASVTPPQNAMTSQNTQVTNQPVTQAPASVNVDMSKLEGKVDEVSRNLALAQRRVVEINNRVKSLQQQYSTVLQSVKQVEKNILEEKLAEQKAAAEQKAEQEAKLEEEKKAESKPAAYQYRAPGALNYESGNRNSYP